MLIPPREIELATVHKSNRNDVLIRSIEASPPAVLDDNAFNALRDRFPSICTLYALGDDKRWHIDNVENVKLATTRLDDSLSGYHEWRLRRSVPHQRFLDLVAGIEKERDRLAATEAYLDFCKATSSTRSSSTEFINNADHYFFYRKVHEHVPGTMLIEAQRQAVYNHFYSNTIFKVGDVTISLNRLDSRFLDYASLMYPIEIVTDDLSPDPIERPRRLSYRVSFYQQARLIAVLDTDAIVIPLSQFDGLRSSFIHDNDWYVPIADETVRCAVERGDGPSAAATLVCVSKAGAYLRLNDDNPPRGADTQIEALSIVDRSGNAFMARTEFLHAQDGVVRVRFTEINRSGSIALSKIVARGFLQNPQPKEIESPRASANRGGW